MNSDEFVKMLEEAGHQKAGLCMVAPPVVAPIANRLLNQAFGDSGDNLSVPLCDIVHDGVVRYLGANYSSASLIHVRNAIDALSGIPGAKILIAGSGVGSSAKEALGILSDGRLDRLVGVEHSFQSFSNSFLSAKLCNDGIPDDPSDLVKPLSFKDIGERIKEVDQFRFHVDDVNLLVGKIIDSLAEIEALISGARGPFRHGGIGHNIPHADSKIPDEIRDPIVVNISIIRSEILSDAPSVVNVAESASILSRLGEELSEFSAMTTHHIKKDGSRAVSAVILAAIGWCLWYLAEWISAVSGISI